MKKLLGLLLFACCSVYGANAQWNAKGSAVLIKGVNQAGNECVMATGSGNGAGWIAADTVY